MANLAAGHPTRWAEFARAEGAAAVARAGAHDGANTLIYQAREAAKAGYQKTFDYLMADAEETYSDATALADATLDMAQAVAANLADKAHSLADNLLPGSIFAPVDLPSTLTPSPIGAASALTPNMVDSVLQYFSAAPSADYSYAVEHMRDWDMGTNPSGVLPKAVQIEKDIDLPFQPNHDGFHGLNDVTLMRGEVPQPGRELEKVTRITDALSSEAVKAFNRGKF